MCWRQKCVANISALKRYFYCIERLLLPPHSGRIADTFMLNRRAREKGVPYESEQSLGNIWSNPFHPPTSKTTHAWQVFETLLFTISSLYSPNLASLIDWFVCADEVWRPNVNTENTFWPFICTYSISFPSLFFLRRSARWSDLPGVTRHCVGTHGVTSYLLA
jgi:hypothetical protein